MNEDDCTCESLHEEHPCPYDEEINPDCVEICTCCPACVRACSEEV